MAGIIQSAQQAKYERQEQQANPGEEQQESPADEQNEPQQQAGQDTWLDDGEDVGSEKATPEEEAQMEALIGPIIGLIHGNGTGRKVIDALKSGQQNLADTIGNLASQMLSFLQDQVESQGKQIDDAVMMQAGEVAVMELITVAQAAGLAPEDDESIGKLFQDAILAGLQAHGKATGGKMGIAPDQARQSLDGMLNAADQQGGPEANKLTSAIRNVINGGGQ